MGGQERHPSLPAPQRPRARIDLCPNEKRQGGRPGRSYAVVVASQHRRHRPQGRVVGDDGRLASEARKEQGDPLRAGDPERFRRLEPTGRNPHRHRIRGWRRAEPSHADRRSRRQRLGDALAENLAGAACRCDPAHPLQSKTKACRRPCRASMPSWPIPTATSPSCGWK